MTPEGKGHIFRPPKPSSEMYRVQVDGLLTLGIPLASHPRIQRLCRIESRHTRFAMNKKRAALAACALGLTVVGAFRISVTTPGTLAQRTQVAHPPEVSQSGGVPEHKAYEFLFRRVAFFRRKTAEAGKPLARDVGLQRETHLSDAQMRALDEIAASCLREVEAVDEEAHAVINAFREQHFPGGKLPEGQQLPPPPPELEALQQRRNAVLLRGRDMLMGALGNAMSGRFDSFVKERFAGKLPNSYADRIQRPPMSGH